MPRPAKPKPAKRPGPGRPPVGLDTERRRRFVAELIADPKLNATQAAIRAGFSKNGAKQRGCILMKDPEIQTALKAGFDERAERTKIDADWVLERLQAIVERCMAVDPEDFNPAAANKSLELLGKHLAMWTEKVQHSGELGVYDGMTVEQKRERAVALAKELGLAGVGKRD